MKNSKLFIAICLILCAMLAFSSCQQPHTADDCVDENKDHKCDVCSSKMGRHEDSNKDHACDYGCNDVIGVCEDVDMDHVCDYGCSKVIGSCEDSDKDHVCDYGCSKVIGECADADKDHTCDYGCGETFGECVDTDNDHACDFGCSNTFGEHTDANNDHVCDYGCDEGIGECADNNKDHVCDYGCSVTVGEHVDADNDHVCDYGCDEGIGECIDEDKDHTCDYGCDKTFGECEDTNNDHSCDYGCPNIFGEHVDAGKDHVCDYGCGQAIGDHVDAEKDHVCDYGCSVAVGEHADEDKNHLCDYGCDKSIGDHADSANDGDHVCDYGCKAVLEDCSDILTDNDHSCDVCNAENITSHVYGEWTKNDSDSHKKTCNCGHVVTENHKWDNGAQTTSPSCTAEGVMTYKCSVCDETKTSKIDALNHDIVNHDAKAPTCTEKGWDAYETCNRCDHNTKVEKEMIAHNYEWIVDRQPTVDAAGVKHEECSVCGAKRNENTSIEKLTCDHSDMVKTDAKSATCTAEGNKEYYFCPDCNKHFSNAEGTLETTVEDSKVAPLGHNMVIDKAVAPTCTATGLTEGSHCSRCDYKIAQQSVPAADHNYNESVTAPTCVAEGYTTFTCSACGDYYTENKVPATGKHSDADADKKCDNCDVVYYVVTLGGGATVSSASDNSSTYPGAYLPGTKLAVSADVYKTVDGKTHMLVGFDLNKVDNRIVDDGSNTVSYTVGEADATITAKYAEANTTFFTTGTFKVADVTGTAITGSTDPDLEGLSGWSIVIPDNTAASNSKTNNITAVSLTAWGPDQVKLVRFVLKNTGNYDVTVEIAGEYFGYMVTTGYVTVPANSKVVAFMDFGPFSGAGSTCDFMLHVREDMKGDGSGTIQLDVVASAAKKYETKVSDFIVTSDKNVFMDFGESNESNTQSNVAHASASGMNMRYWDQYGVMYFYGNNNKSADTFARERANAIGGEAIDLTSGKTITIYVKVTNLYHAGGGKYNLVFTRGSSSLSSAFMAQQTVEFSEYGESHVYKIEIDPSKAGAATSANLQFGLKKAKADGTGGKIDVLVQIASENIFGEEPVN